MKQYGISVYEGNNVLECTVFSLPLRFLHIKTKHGVVVYMVATVKLFVRPKVYSEILTFSFVK